MKVFYFVWILITFFSCETLAQVTVSPNSVRTHEELINRYIDEQYLTGAMVSTINGSEIQHQSYGTKIFGQDLRADVNTIYEIGSISKVFTGIILASLIVDGVVKDSDHIGEFIIEVASLDIGKITLKELATHTSGLPRMPNNFNPADSSNPFADYTEEKLLEFMLSHTPSPHPTEFSWDYYSNLGMGILGFALTRATNRTYEDLLAEYITVPLNMPDTAVTLNSDQQLRFASAHSSALFVKSQWDLDVLAPAGGIRSTAKDMVKFIQSNMNPDQTSISAALKLTQQIHATSKDGAHIGYAWSIKDHEDGLMIEHNGLTGGFSAQAGFLKGGGKGAVLLKNTAAETLCFSEVTYGPKDCSIDFGFQASEENLLAYQGVYVGEASGLTFEIVKRAHHLAYLIPDRGESYALTTTSETEFNLWKMAFFEFNRDELGSVNNFKFTQGGYTERFIKK